MLIFYHNVFVTVFVDFGHPTPCRAVRCRAMPHAMQGKLVEDFASLLKSLWSQEYLCVFPSKFKRGLIKYKPQFAGNEQQDSQVLLCCCAQPTAVRSSSCIV